jgi:hypothetical protein
MLRRSLVIALVLALLTPAAAVAQGNQNSPFSPLPPAQPTPAPTPEEDNGGFLGLNDEISGSASLYIIAGVLLVAFVAIGMFISRDARRSLPEHHRPDSHRMRDQGPHKHKRQAKAKARARGRAQKVARRKNR